MQVTAEFTLRTVSDSRLVDGALPTSTDPSSYSQGGDKTGARPRKVTWDANIGISSGERHALTGTSTLRIPWTSRTRRSLFAVGCRDTKLGNATVSPSTEFTYKLAVAGQGDFGWGGGDPPGFINSADYPVVGSAATGASCFVFRMNVGTMRLHGPSLYLLLQSDSSWLHVEGEEEAALDDYNFYG